jgi:hypothetical protein
MLYRNCVMMSRTIIYERLHNVDNNHFIKWRGYVLKPRNITYFLHCAKLFYNIIYWLLCDVVSKHVGNIVLRHNLGYLWNVIQMFCSIIFINWCTHVFKLNKLILFNVKKLCCITKYIILSRYYPYIIFFAGSVPCP